MKLEITDVMICEWDADTKCIIVSPAEGWKVNVNHPISASLVTMEKMEGPYSGLDGKWLKWVGASDPFMTNGKWYKIDHVQGEKAFFYNDLFDQDAVNLYACRFNTSDARDYNPDELIGKWIKRTDRQTGDQSWGKLKEIHPYSPNDLNPHFVFEDNVHWGKIACDVDDPRDYNPDEKPEAEKEPEPQTRRVIQKGTRVMNLVANGMIKKGATGSVDETSDVPYVIWDSNEMLTEEGQCENRRWARYSEFLLELPSEPKPEPKPHQLKEYDAVECSPEERAQIIRIADECGVRVYSTTKTGEGSLLFPNLVFTGSMIVGTEKEKRFRSKNNWHTVPDFIAKIRGTYREVNVTEHKHESV